MKDNFKYIESIPLYKFFHLNTALDKYTVELLTDHIHKVRQEADFYSKANNPIDISENELILLPDPSDSIEVYISDLIRNRISQRRFIPFVLSQNILSDILYYSFGAKGTYLSDFIQSYAYPSAGGFNSLRIYLIVNSVEGIEQGAYLYVPNKNALINQKIKFSYNDYRIITGSFDLSVNCCYSVHFVGDMTYIGHKYCDRAYRFMCIEAGHAMQNMYLVLTALGMGCVASGGFYDIDFLQKMNNTNDENLLLYEAFVGRYYNGE